MHAVRRYLYSLTNFLSLLVFTYLLIIANASALSLDKAQDADVNFITLSDIHFDPFASCTRIPCPIINKLRSTSSANWYDILSVDDKAQPAYREDTNIVLLKNALEAAKQAAVQHHAQFVLVMGDSLGHQYRRYYKKFSGDKSNEGYRLFVKKTLEFLAEQLSAAFPEISVYTLVGNNDSYQDNYTTQANGQFFKDTRVIWSALIKGNQAISESFNHAGYYTFEVPSLPILQFVVLNSNLFSSKAKGADLDVLAKEELNWLHVQLDAAVKNHKRTIILMHIPEAVDIYLTQRIRLVRLVTLWKEQYIKQFQAEINLHAENIAAIFSGHLHTNWSAIMTTPSGVEIPLLGIPSISPFYGNDPQFKLITLSPNASIVNDNTVFRLPLLLKKHLSFN